MRFRVVLITSVLVLALSSFTYADTLGVDFTGGYDFTDAIQANGWTVGYEFNVLNPITLTGLAVWFVNPTGDPMENHLVGVWAFNGTTSTLLASGTVTANDPLIGSANFHYITLSNPVVLPVAAGYRVGAQSGFVDTYKFDGSAFYGSDPAFTGFTVGSGIAFVQDAWIEGSGLNFPDQTTGMIGYFGGNILFTPGGETPVPEPTSLLLLGSGIGALLLATWRKRK
jgi:hypothetical protein